MWLPKPSLKDFLMLKFCEEITTSSSDLHSSSADNPSSHCNLHLHLVHARSHQKALRLKFRYVQCIPIVSLSRKGSLSVDDLKEGCHLAMNLNSCTFYVAFGSRSLNDCEENTSCWLQHQGNKYS